MSNIWEEVNRSIRIVKITAVGNLLSKCSFEDQRKFQEMFKIIHLGGLNEHDLDNAINVADRMSDKNSRNNI